MVKEKSETLEGRARILEGKVEGYELEGEILQEENGEWKAVHRVSSVQSDASAATIYDQSVAPGQERLSFALVHLKRIERVEEGLVRWVCTPNTNVIRTPLDSYCACKLRGMTTAMDKPQEGDEIGFIPIPTRIFTVYELTVDTVLLADMCPCVVQSSSTLIKPNPTPPRCRSEI